MYSPNPVGSYAADIEDIMAKTEDLQQTTRLFSRSSKPVTGSGKQDRTDRYNRILNIVGIVSAILITIGIGVILAHHYGAISLLQSHLSNLTPLQGALSVSIPVVGVTMLGLALYMTISCCRAKKREQKQKQFRSAPQLIRESATRLNAPPLA